MFSKRNLYRNLFFVFFLSIFFTFFYFRPLNSSWYRIITADGLGYYSYLPAKFIYHDSKLEFKWFNDVYNQYYSYNSFNVPDENFMAPYKDRRINKYYPGLSFLWLPFFIPVHIACKLFHLHANGFSLPYQVAIGFATLVYVCMGLWYLKKLLLKITGSEFISFLIPVAVYYGTNLFSYTIFVGTYSHAYSFTFITMACYFFYLYWNESDKKFTNLLSFILCFLIVIFIRPFNILFVIALPFLATKFKPIQPVIPTVNLNIKNSSLFVCMIALITYQFALLYNQTGSLFPNTYTNEKFYFDRPSHVWDVLFSYYAGWMVYVPLAFIACFALFFVRSNTKTLFLFLLLAIVVYLYSNWWYYTIVTRAIVDYTGIVALLLAFLFMQITHRPKIYKSFVLLVIFSVAYFQLKAFQLRNNILDNNYTYSDYFWRNFFTLRKVSVFPVYPKTILNQQSYSEDFEKMQNKFVVNEEKKDGSYSFKLCAQNHFTPEWIYKMPDFFGRKGIRKIRTSFWIYPADDLKKMQLIYKFYSAGGKEIHYLPFYMDESFYVKDKWNYLELGCDVLQEIKSTDSMKVFFWNNEGLNKCYLDNVKTEFFLTDSSMEMIP